MKTKILNTFGIAVILTIVFAITSFIPGDDSTTDISLKPYVIVNVVEAANTWNSQIRITWEDGKMEVIELENIKPKNIKMNSSMIQKTLSRFSEEGYMMVSSNGGHTTNCFTSTYIFQKP